MRTKTRSLFLVVAGAAVAQAVYLAFQREEGDPFLGLGMLAACVAYLTVVTANRGFASPRTVTGREQANHRWWVPLRSLALAVALIGLPDVTFVATYWCSCGGSWYAIPFRHGPRALNLDGLAVGAGLALVVASLLRCALWSSDIRRSFRLALLFFAVWIVALALAGAWLVPRERSIP